MVAFYATPGHETNFVGEVVSISDEPSLAFKAEGGGCQSHWLASLCRPATKDEEIDYWQARALRDGWDGKAERREGQDRRRTYGRREIDSH